MLHFESAPDLSSQEPHQVAFALT